MFVIKIFLTIKNETSNYKNMKINSNLKTIVFIIAIYLTIFEYYTLTFEQNRIFLILFTKIINIAFQKR